MLAHMPGMLGFAAVLVLLFVIPNLGAYQRRAKRWMRRRARDRAEQKSRWVS